tara:strand:+ start:195 stop:473 length:279 start_codon:yes stop_codon:yes gene_type:complete
MKLQELIELTQQHHPELGHNQIILEANRALNDFSMQTKLVRGTFDISTVIDKRYYDLDNSIIEIEEVIYDVGAGKGTAIPRLINKPQVKDIT